MFLPNMHSGKDREEGRRNSRRKPKQFRSKLTGSPVPKQFNGPAGLSEHALKRLRARDPKAASRATGRLEKLEEMR